MRRREVLLTLAAAMATRGSLAIAQAKTARIGVLSSISPASAAAWHAAFTQSLREHGWIEGRNLAIDYRYTDAREERRAALAAELVKLNVDVIVVATTPDALAVQKVTRTSPVVMAVSSDPVGSGLVESLARPGGNITGSSQIAPELVGKRLELLREMIPRLSRIAVIWNPQGPASLQNWKEMQEPAQRLAIQLQSLEVRGPGDFVKAFEELTKARPPALVLLPDPVINANLRHIAEFAIKQRMPSAFHIAEFVEAGGLLAYGVNRTELYRRAAGYVDKILRGAKPADLPVEQPNKFQLAINLRTARAIGLAIPQDILLRADKVIG